ncbi:hypothetical protein F4678DRAFT_379377 [Xylaria arbuscula]|nr:hypothetical protein F4678DRAFT_379377 [Xylaria arbuscula]
MGSPREGRQGDDAAPPPPYDETSQASFEAASAATDSKQDAARARPTVDSPFNFPPPAPRPEYSDLPEVVSPATQYSDLPEAVHPGPDYSNLPEPVFPSGGGSSTSYPSSSSSSTPSFLAIPQVAAKATAPFPAAYNRPFLLRRGVTQDAFTSFLATLSAFLTASVSERALTHAQDVGRSLNDVPKRLTQDTFAYAKTVGRRAEARARKGNFIGAGVAALAGAVTIPVVGAVHVAGAALRLPAAVGGGLAKKPLSPRERADAYLAVAQKDWFGQRGLTVSLCTTVELLRRIDPYAAAAAGSSSGLALGLDNENEAAVRKLVDLAHRTWEGGPAGQLQALQSEFGLAPLEIATDDKVKFLDIGAGTLWLFLTEAQSGDNHHYQQQQSEKSRKY